MNELERPEHERIAKVLHALREAEPAEGLEQRVLRAVRTHAPNATQTKRHSVWTASPLWPSAAAAAAVVLVSLLTLWATHPPRPQQTAERSPHRVARQGPGVPNLAPPAHFAAVPHPAHAQPGTAADPRATPPPKRSGQASRVDPNLLFAGGNHPAPEAPLTDEERLLLRIAHRGNAAQFAILNHDARDAQAKSDKAEFQTFFGPPPPPTGDNE